MLQTIRDSVPASHTNNRNGLILHEVTLIREWKQHTMMPDSDNEAT